MENICTPLEQYVAEFNSCEEEIGGRGERMQQGDMGDSSVLKRGDLLRKGSGKMRGGVEREKGGRREEGEEGEKVR